MLAELKMALRSKIPPYVNVIKHQPKNTGGIELNITPSLWRQIISLIKRECGYYLDGYCLRLECDCVQKNSRESLENTGIFLCKHVPNVLLPLDPALQASIMNTVPIKKCIICGIRIVAQSNSAKYCPKCAKEVRRRQKAAFERHRRGKPWTNRHTKHS